MIERWANVVEDMFKELRAEQHWNSRGRLSRNMLSWFWLFVHSFHAPPRGKRFYSSTAETPAA